MNSATNDMFYSRLPVNEIALSELLTEEHLFFKIPDNWHVIITDVKGSTRAVEDGMHETINLLATGCIVAVLNIAYKAGLTIPFFFGGDGASFILPASILDNVEQALLIHQQNSKQNFDISLRVGHVPVAEIYSQELELRITKLRASPLFSIPVLLGDGLGYAEQVIKKEGYRLQASLTARKQPDLAGMQCRWDKIKPPQTFDEVVSLLVLAAPGV